MADCILVTGGTGFLGPWVVERLMAHGVRRIRCLVRPSSDISRLESIRRRHPESTVEYVQGTMTSPPALAAAIRGVSQVYHLAAALRGSPADMYLSTVAGSKRLIDAIGSMPVRVILVSSFSVYGVADLPKGATIDENTPLEAHPERRDVYAQTKLRQEQLFREWAAFGDMELVVLRPGVIYGPGGNAFSVRVGMQLPGLFLHLGGSNQLPLSFVENCAEAVAVAGISPGAVGRTLNVHDDSLPSASEYLAAYRQSVKKIPCVRIPYWVTQKLSAVSEYYYRWSHGQLPAVLTRYRTASAWKPQRFDNRQLRDIGWRQLVPTEEALRRSFSHFAAQCTYD